MRFPKGFLWGASTAAYQIEGDNVRSAFWEWETRKGWEPSGKAADSWRLWRRDLDCLKSLGLNAYRFSVEWSRVEPYPGEFDEEALERYAEMARAFRRAGVRPIACLHHFSEPSWLFKSVPKGWLSGGTVEAFLRFADRAVAALRPEVQDWITFNEPMVHLVMGYALGHFPPGFRKILTLERSFRPLLSNVVRAHNEAYRMIHRDIPGARVSVAQNVADLEPARAGVEDLEALRAWDLFMHGKLLDMAISSGTLDFLGLNYYTRIFVNKCRLAPLGAFPAYGEVEDLLGSRVFNWLGGRRGDRPRSDMGWEIVPEGLGRVVERLWKAYRLPILVTENGIADSTGTRREDYLRDHLASLGSAMEDGAVVLGYLHWSLVDNYEWGSYRPRFGLFHLDKAGTFKRLPSEGARYYSQVARRNSL